MEKEFVPCKEALELKELGFDEPCFGYYTGDLIHLVIRPSMSASNLPEAIFVTAPTYSQAFRWFRKKYDLRIRNYGAINYSGELSEYFEIFQYAKGTSDKTFSIQVGALTYEEAELTCLKKLIEIVKEKK